MRRRAWVAVVAIVAAGVGDVVANVAPLPGSWTPYLWLAWPVLAVLLLVVVVAEVAAHRPGHGEPPSAALPLGAGAPVTVQQVIASGGGQAFGAAGGGSIHYHGAPPSPDDGPAAGPAPVEPR